MLYYLFDYLETEYQLIGASLFQFITFRSSVSFILSLMLSSIYGAKLIKLLKQKQIKEEIRNLGLDNQSEKKEIPTMGGIIIIFATLIPVFLFTKLHNIYIIILIVTTIWMGIIGFIDDYIKVIGKNKVGLKGKFKILGQFGLGIFVGLMLYFHPSVTIKEESLDKSINTKCYKSTKTTIPFFKNNEFDYASLLNWIGDDMKDYAWMIFIPAVILIVISVSNGANLTDGIDGLAAGSSAIIVLTLGLFTWISGNIIFSEYLNVMYIPNSGEMTVYISAFAGSLIGFLWYNIYPAQIFMGDTGSLTIGGIISVIAISVRKELLIPILAGIFFMENLSVVIQVSWFKYTKRRYGKGRRVFKMAPLHHHFQMKGYHENKIVSRFLIIGILLAVFSIVTLKMR